MPGLHQTSHIMHMNVPFLDHNASTITIHAWPKPRTQPVLTEDGNGQLTTVDVPILPPRRVALPVEHAPAEDAPVGELEPIPEPQKKCGGVCSHCTSATIPSSILTTVCRATSVFVLLQAIFHFLPFHPYFALFKYNESNIRLDSFNHISVKWILQHRCSERSGFPSSSARVASDITYYVYALKRLPEPQKNVAEYVPVLLRRKYYAEQAQWL
ncbi:hypothetical protein CAEBREN_07732 [Caenorhabditis brenneri]|uniref:Uncharacterized protein n=1 Tax=Caenorhabditis brenneri TaxID=135651 RepID=G0NZJ5_CAEBE|nr:hypothetical protein CAEBREN_07732 [Caenorhabditis brenneri]